MYPVLPDLLSLEEEPVLLLGGVVVALPDDDGDEDHPESVPVLVEDDPVSPLAFELPESVDGVSVVPELVEEESVVPDPSVLLVLVFVDPVSVGGVLSSAKAWLERTSERAAAEARLFFIKRLSIKEGC